jgi:hypothetical protein
MSKSRTICKAILDYDIDIYLIVQSKNIWSQLVTLDDFYLWIGFGGMLKKPWKMSKLLKESFGSNF